MIGMLTFGKFGGYFDSASSNGQEAQVEKLGREDCAFPFAKSIVIKLKRVLGVNGNLSLVLNDK